MPDTLYATTVRTIQDELTRLREIGYTVSFDCEEGWLVATDRDGASSIIARLEEPRDA